MYKNLAVLLGALTLMACANTANVSTEKGKPSPGIVIKEYKIGVGDQLQVSVWENAGLSAVVPVRPDGKISIPLVGDIQASDLSTAELAKSMAAELDNYIRNPQVTVIVLEANSAEYLQRVRVTGAVLAPQSIPYRRGMTVLDLVLQAGGVTPYASANKALLYRQTSDGVKVYSVKVQDIMNAGKLDTNYQMQPADILTIPESVF